METTMLFEEIEKNLKKSKVLLPFASKILESINPKSTLTLKGMNDKQIFSQIYSQISLSFQKVSKTLEKQSLVLQPLQNQHQQEQIAQDQNQHLDEEEPDQEEQIQDNQEDMDIQGGSEDQGVEVENQSDLQNMERQDRIQQQDQQNQVQQNDQDNEQDQQEMYEGEDDIGLYGQELNEQQGQMEDYANQFDEEQFKQFEKEVGAVGKKKKQKKIQEEQEVFDEVDDNIEDNFDHFRQIEIKNQQTRINEPKSQLQNQIDKLQNKIIGQKDWTMKGQVKARQRPLNSLLQYDLQFASGVKYSHQITQEKNSELQQLIKKRILDELFDDRSRYVSGQHIRQHFGSLKQVSRQKSKMGLSELYQNQFKNFLGLGDNKNDNLKKEIMDSFKEVNYYLDSLSNLNFTPKPVASNANKKQTEAIIVQQKVPLTLWNGQNQKQVPKDGKFNFESQKQVDGKAKRMKNKRIARQRKKQQTRKKINKKIEYGGMTKFQAQAQTKSLMNKKPLKVDGQNIKYNKSGKFFKNLNQKSQKGDRKPNANLGKMKI